MKKKMWLSAFLMGMGALVAGSAAVFAEEAQVYEANGVKIYLDLENDGINENFIFRVENETDGPVIVRMVDLLVNNILVDRKPSSTPDMLFVDTMIGVGIFEEESTVERVNDMCYVPAGESDTRTVTLYDSLARDSYSLKELWKVEDIGKVTASFCIFGLKDELTFGVEEQPEFNEVSFYDISELLDYKVEDSSWDGSFQEIDGKVVLEGDDWRLIELGPDIRRDSKVKFRFVLENNAEGTAELACYDFDDESLINGMTPEMIYGMGEALPGTISEAYISVEATEGSIPEESALKSFSAPVYLYAPDGNRIDFTYTWGEEQDLAVDVLSEEIPSEETVVEANTFMDVSVEEQIIYDADGFVVKLLGVEENDYQENVLLCSAEIMNNTDQDVILLPSELAMDMLFVAKDQCFLVNGFQIDGTIWISCPAGETVQEAFYVDTAILPDFGIDNIGEIAFKMVFYDSNKEVLNTAAVSEIKTDHYDDMDITLDDAIVKVAEAGGLIVKARYVEESKEILVAFENHSGTNLDMSFRQVMVNGILNEDMYDFSGIAEGKTLLAKYKINQDFIDANEISSVDALSAEISFRTADSDEVMLGTVSLLEGTKMLENQEEAAEIAEPDEIFVDAALTMAVQQKLNEVGCECGTADGIAGAKTYAAIEAYQAMNGLTVTGKIDQELITHMNLG